MTIKLGCGSRVRLVDGGFATLKSRSPDTGAFWGAFDDGTGRWITDGEVEAVVVRGGRFVDYRTGDRPPGLITFDEMLPEEQVAVGAGRAHNKKATAAVDVGRSAITISIETILRRDDLPGREVVVRETDGKRTVSAHGCSFEGMSLDETRMVAEMLIEAARMQ